MSTNDNVITTKEQACKDCGWICMFGNTSTCPNCKPDEDEE